MIARIQTPSVNVRRLINALLIDIGKAHPQALIYPLTVASGSSSVTRQTAASMIMDRMKEHSPVLVEQVRGRSAQNHYFSDKYRRHYLSVVS